MKLNLQFQFAMTPMFIINRQYNTNIAIMPLIHYMSNFFKKNLQFNHLHLMHNCNEQNIECSTVSKVPMFMNIIWNDLFSILWFSRNKDLWNVNKLYSLSYLNTAFPQASHKNWGWHHVSVCHTKRIAWWVVSIMHNGHVSSRCKVLLPLW
jgi:hypothetical protein